MRYAAKVDELNNVLADIESKLDAAMVSPKIVIGFLVAVEEIFVNVASYAYSGADGFVDIDFAVEDNQAKISFTDEGVEFNPLDREDPDVNASAEERGIGGLGIYMVKKSMDGIVYNRVDGKNVLSFWKNLD